MNEEWRALPGWEGLYDVSNQGRVRSWRPWRGRPAPWVMSPADSRGYRQISLTTRDGVHVKTRVHALVAKAFMPPRPAGMELCHKDGNGWNNAADNLRWDTPAGNNRDKIKHDTHNRGTRHYRAVLTETKVRDARVRRAGGESVASIARGFGMSRTGLLHAIEGRTWGWVK